MYTYTFAFYLQSSLTLPSGEINGTHAVRSLISCERVDGLYVGGAIINYDKKLPTKATRRRRRVSGSKEFCFIFSVDTTSGTSAGNKSRPPSIFTVYPTLPFAFPLEFDSCFSKHFCIFFFFLSTIRTFRAARHRWKSTSTVDVTTLHVKFVPSWLF